MCFLVGAHIMKMEKKTGHWDYFDQNGDLTQTIDYKPEDSLFTYKNYFSSGGLSSEGKYKNDLDEGEALSFYIGGGKNTKQISAKALKKENHLTISKMEVFLLKVTM